MEPSLIKQLYENSLVEITQKDKERFALEKDADNLDHSGFAIMLIDAISYASNLKRLDTTVFNIEFDYEMLNKLVSSILKSDSLEMLNITIDPWRDGELEDDDPLNVEHHLPKLIKRLPTLVDLHVQIAEGDDTGGEEILLHLFSSLEVNTTLKKLTITAPYLFDANFEDSLLDLFEALSRLFLKNTTIVEFELLNCTLHEHGMEKLKDILTSAPALKRFRLADFADDEFRIFQNVLSTQTATLTDLTLDLPGEVSYNVRSIALGLSNNTTLKTLRIIHEASDAAGGYFVVGLEELFAVMPKTKITTLCVYGVPPNDPDASHMIASALKNNDTLLSLELGLCKIANLPVLKLALDGNLALTDLNMTKTSHPSFDAMALSFILRDNGGITYFRPATRETVNIVLRNARAHARTRAAMDTFEAGFRKSGLGRDVIEYTLEKLWQTRGQSVWWTRKEGGSYEEEKEPQNKRQRIWLSPADACIQCKLLSASLSEIGVDNPRKYCSFYCQWMHRFGHANQVPDVRGLNPAQIAQLLQSPQK